MESENVQQQGHHFTGCDVTIIQDAEIHNYAGAEDESKIPTSVIRVRQLNSNLLETKTYTALEREVSLRNIQILQCHGLPGSGKSQTVLKLAENFPFSGNVTEVLIKWHIQCKDSGHDVKQELKKLTEEMRKHFLLKDDQKYQTIVQNLSDGIGSSLVDAFLESNVPVLLIIEDPNVDIEREKLLIDIFRKMMKEKQENGAPPFHVYITSRVENPVFPKGEDLDRYKKVQVQGFDQEEGLRFLEPDKNSEDEKAAALKIFKRLTGSPLGLCATKRYRDASLITYSGYLRLLKECEYEINRSERDAILKEFGPNVEHVFQALAMPFRERAKSDWQLLCCISYLHYDDIPRYIIEKFFQQLQKDPIKNPELIIAKSGRIMTTMQEYSMGIISSDKEEITSHEVVQNAFKLCVAAIQKEESKETFYPLAKAVEVMSGLVTKDIRQRDTSLLMHKIRRHLQSLLENVERNKDLVDKSKPLNRALVGYLYETTAAIMLKFPELIEECEKYFHKALDLTWGKERTESLLKNRDENEPLEPLAKSTLKESEKLGSNMPDQFVLHYESKVQSHFNEDQINFLNKKCSGDFTSVREAIENKEPPHKIIPKLRNKKLFLAEEKHRAIFYAERVASVLHSWSRLWLRADTAKATNMHRKYMWMSELSQKISQEVKTSHDIPLLIEEMTARVMTSLLVKQKHSLDEVKRAKALCEEALLRDLGDQDFYENGLLSQHRGSSQVSTQIYFLRSLVRSNSRLMKTCQGDLKFITEADKTCERFSQLANSNVKSITNAAECIVYCGKYYASKKEYDKALDCFQRFFDVEERSNHFSRHCWAVFNFARAVCCSASRNQYTKAKEMCQDILDSNESMPASLNKLVREQLTTLNNL